MRQRGGLGLFDDFKARYYALVQQYKDAIASLDATEMQLYDVKPIADANYNDAQEWQSQLSKVIAARTAADQVETNLSRIRDFFSSVGDAVGLSGIRMNPTGLGVLPVVPWSLVTLIVGGITAITAVVYAANSFITSLRRKAYEAAVYTAQQNGDTPPEVPPDLYSGNSGGTVFGDLSNIMQWLVIGGVIWLVAPKILDRFERKRA